MTLCVLHGRGRRRRASTTSVEIRMNSRVALVDTGYSDSATNELHTDHHSDHTVTSQSPQEAKI